jgi:hypothetical protein
MCRTRQCLQDSLTCGSIISTTVYTLVSCQHSDSSFLFTIIADKDSSSVVLGLSHHMTNTMTSSSELVVASRQSCRTGNQDFLGRQGTMSSRSGAIGLWREENRRQQRCWIDRLVLVFPEEMCTQGRRNELSGKAQF